MKLKVGYLYKDNNGDIYITTIYNDTPPFPYTAEKITSKSNTLKYFTFTAKGHINYSPSPMDLIEEIGKVEDYPEYFL